MNPAFPSSLLRARPSARAGSTLAATLIVVATLVTFLSISALLTSQFGRYGGRQAGNQELLAAADAGLEYIYAEWSTGMRKTGNSPANAVFAVSASNLNSASLPFNAAGITFSTVSLSPADQNGTAVGTIVGTANSSVPEYPGWTGTTYNFLASVTVQDITGSNHYGFAKDSTPSLTVYRVFQYTQVPLFQAAIFYQNKLEIHPGAAMEVTGLVHSNNDLWARGFSSLTFKNNVSYVGTYHEIGDATIKDGWGGGGEGYIPGVGAFASVPQVTWSDGKTTGSSSSRATQLNQVNAIKPFGNLPDGTNGMHDLVEVPTSSTNPLIAQQSAYNQASVVVTVDSSATKPADRLSITDNQGNALSAADTAAIKNAVNNGTTTSIYDQREGSNVVVTTLDMAKLAAATVVKSGVPATSLQGNFSGTIYIHDISKATATESAVRLINGRNLGQNVTVASDNAVYIQGDYNTGGTGPSDVPSNVSNPTGAATPQATGYPRYSSAVMADAVTVLSNNWSDSNASQPLSKRTATPTTVNTAILSGDVPSDSKAGTASGGAHNFPRFLENWNNVNFTYWGSLVEAYKSEEFTGAWQTGQVYYWPNRMWNFDTNFVSKPPPGTASGINFSRGRWWRD